MKLIVGLGNPGEKFKNTRHNLGFLVADAFARSRALSWRYSQDFMGFFIKGEELIILKPSTFMNISGQSVAHLANFYKIKTRDILAVHDDLDFAFGKIRIAIDGSSGGHQGIESMISHLAASEFARLRVGIGHPRDSDSREAVDKYVLSKFTDAEQKKLPEIIRRGVEAIDAYLLDGIDATMNSFN